MKRYGISDWQKAQLVGLLTRWAELADALVPEVAIRDASDLPVVAAAVAGRADAIVTRDADFLGDEGLIAELARQGIEVLTIQRFLDRLDSLS